MPSDEQTVLSLATHLLQEKMNPTEVVTHLVSNNTITHSDSLAIREERPTKQNQALIDCLFKKDNFLHRFLFVLIETGQGPIVEKINEFLPTVELEPIDVEATRKAIIRENRMRPSTENWPPALRFKTITAVKTSSISSASGGSQTANSIVNSEMDPVRRSALNKSRKFFSDNMGNFTVLGTILLAEDVLSGPQFEKLQRLARNEGDFEATGSLITVLMENGNRAYDVLLKGLCDRSVGKSFVATHIENVERELRQQNRN